ncbi:hypothetical protein EVAR_17990_1 [Eumeta japonica]|uniref:Uncharacterized protein n=1 Tax=Eumeta variegata TaxID=151549 RepID=A0A4C1Y9I6_EUMVA|nr:hypothetical protein EVAR_17990_1 [Eumeta japonica]
MDPDYVYTYVFSLRHQSQIRCSDIREITLSCFRRILQIKLYVGKATNLLYFDDLQKEQTPPKAQDGPPARAFIDHKQPIIFLIGAGDSAPRRSRRARRRTAAAPSLNGCDQLK